MYLAETYKSLKSLTNNQKHAVTGTIFCFLIHDILNRVDVPNSSHRNFVDYDTGSSFTIQHFHASGAFLIINKKNRNRNPFLCDIVSISIPWNLGDSDTDSNYGMRNWSIPSFWS